MTPDPDRLPTPEEIETAKAWVEYACADWPARSRPAEYERALAVIVFANDRRGGGR